MPRTLRALLIAVLATGATVAGVVLARPPERTDDAPRYESVPLAAYDTSTVTLARAAFCDALPDDAVAEGLGGGAESATGWGNGDRARLTSSVRDVAHEFGCVWRTSSATARAWVFAPPVTERRARELVDAARSDERCEAITDAPAFGRPSSGSVCTDDARERVTFRGLFGDAWVTCEISATPGAGEELVDRTGRWCVAVVEAIRAG